MANEILPFQRKINEIKLGRNSHLPDLTESNSVIIALRQALSTRIKKTNFFIGRHSQTPLDFEIDLLLSPTGFLYIWMMATVLMMRPMMLNTSAKNRVGFNLYLEKDKDAICDYRVQSFSARSIINVIPPMLTSISRCYDKEKDKIFLDIMLSDVYNWFENHEFKTSDFQVLSNNYHHFVERK